jgi:hypothetical protein
MKHASATTLLGLQPLLLALRALPGLTERKPGIFYAKAQAYLHFHEDPAGLFADVKLDGKTFERYAVNTVAEQSALLKRVRAQRGA